MLVQRWARNDNGKKCSRAKLKPVGIEIIDDNNNVPITVPLDGRHISHQLCNEDNDHIPFWASWETNSYVVVDQDAFEKACNQALIAGWDGKLGSKGSYYQNGLPQECGLTVASSHSLNSNQSSTKYSKRKQRKRHRINMESDNENDEDTDNEDVYKQNVRNNDNNNRNHRSSQPTFPPRIDFPEIVVQNLERSLSENDSIATSEPPIKKQKLNNGRTKNKIKHQQQIYNQFNIASNNQFIHNTLPSSVPFPATVSMQPLNASPFMNTLNHQMLSNSSPENQHQCSSDTGSQHSKYMKSEPMNEQNNQFQVHMPHFIAAFPPNSCVNSHSQAQYQPLSNTNSHNLVPLTAAFPTYPHTLSQQQQQQSMSDNCNNVNIIKEDNHICKERDDGIISVPSLPPIHTKTEIDEHRETTPIALKRRHSIRVLGDVHLSEDDETRNSVIFTPATHGTKNSSSTISTDSNCSKQDNCNRMNSIHSFAQPPATSLSTHTHSQQQQQHQQLQRDNYAINWNNNESVHGGTEWNDQQHIGMMNEINIPVSGFDGVGVASGSNCGEDANGLKGSLFYG